MRQYFAYFFFVLLTIATVDCRFERTGYVSDPMQLLIQLSDASAASPARLQYAAQPMRRQIRKRKYTVFPPTFYSSFGFGSMPYSRRQNSLPYSNMLFAGR